MNVHIFLQYDNNTNSYFTNKIRVIGHHKNPTVCTAVSTLMQMVGLEFMSRGHDAFNRNYEEHSSNDDVEMTVEYEFHDHLSLLLTLVEHSLQELAKQYGGMTIERFKYGNETYVQ